MSGIVYSGCEWARSLLSMRNDFGVYILPNFTPSGRPSVHRGLYAIFIEKLFSIYPRDQIYVSNLHVRTKDRVGSLERMFAFLGLGELFSEDLWVREEGLCFIKIVTWTGMSYRISMSAMVGQAGGVLWLGAPHIQHYCYCHFCFTATISISTSITDT